MDRISLADIYTFYSATPNTRNMVEGENILNSGHLINCGYISMCLQTSAIRDKPHNITGSLQLNENGLKVTKILCTCKAGNSQKCKHIVSTLLYLNRNGISSLEPISQTDLKCSWSGQKTVLNQYLPKPLKDHLCFSQKSTISMTSLSDEKQKHITQILIDRNKNSAISIHGTGRQHIYNKDIENTNNITSPSEDFKNMFNLIEKRSTNIIQIEFDFLRDCCQKQYEKIACVNVASVCFDSSIFKYIWETQRKFRITGLRYYSLYTYSENKNPNWQIKSNKYFSLYVSNKNPWLGYSADGVVFEFGKPIKLLEIKCPFLGKTAGIKEVLEKCKYISIVKGIYTLKNRHPYYGQIQLGIFKG
ncbi:hypothetical protein QTP88_019681 [Uroleucon formosanum]